MFKTRRTFPTPSRNAGAFTLAETLITLVIIGVVAALTIPTLMQKKIEDDTVSRILKIYKNLSAAVQTYQLENGCIGHISNCDISNNASIDQIIKRHMAIANSCSSAAQCQAADWLPDRDTMLTGALQNSAWEGASKYSHHAYLLNDGMIVSLHTESSRNVLIMVDVNGKKGPNRVGKDVFNMTLGARHGDVVDPRYTTITPYTIDDEKYGGLCTIFNNSTVCDPDVCTSTSCSPTAYVLKNKKLPHINW